MADPLVSVITRTKNRIPFVKDALESIATQDYLNWEVMLVNDAGEDIASSVVEPFREKKRVKYLFTKEPLGRAGAANWGFQEAQGKYIAYLDDDDLFYPNHLRILVDHLEKGEFKVAYTDAYQATQRKAGEGYEIVQREKILSYEFSVLRFYWLSYIPLVVFMHHRECMDTIGAFDESLEVLEDLDLYIRYAHTYKFCHIPEVTAEYRIRDDGTNAITTLHKQFIETREALQKKYFTLVIPRLLMHFKDHHERLTSLEEAAVEFRKGLEELAKKNAE